MNEKPEDHPLWPAFVEVMEEDRCICGECMKSMDTLGRWTWFLAGAKAVGVKVEVVPRPITESLDALHTKLDRNSGKLDRILARPVGRNDAKLDRILAIVKEETGCANEVIAKLDRILEILGSPQEFSMNFRLAAEPPQTGSKSGG